MEIMQSLEAIERVENRHQDQLRHAEAHQLMDTPPHRARPRDTASSIITQPIRLVVLMLLLTLVLEAVVL